ncbi:MAG: acyl-CoA dehydrogenase family protein [Solirubrobacterales bacterium]
MDRLIFEDEHNWFRESVKTVVDREILPRAEQIREERSIPREIWLKAGEWADARVTKIWAGSNEIMKEIIGRSLGFGDPRRG